MHCYISRVVSLGRPVQVEHVTLQVANYANEVDGDVPRVTRLRDCWLAENLTGTLSRADNSLERYIICSETIVWGCGK
jgi:hypothetical protein